MSGWWDLGNRSWAGRVGSRLALLLAGAAALLVLAGAPATAQPGSDPTAAPLVEPLTEVEAPAPVGINIELTPHNNPGIVDSIRRLYLATLGRPADDGGREYWVGLYLTGRSLDDIAGWFMQSDEWAARYGDVDDEQFVDLLYQNVLGRAADAEGRSYWLSVLGPNPDPDSPDSDSGSSAPTRSELLTYFSESAEFVAQTGTADPVAPPPYVPPVPADSGSGRRIVYDNDAHRVWLIEADESIHDSYLVSGKANTPNVGTYKVFSKSEKAWAGHDGITMDHMVRFTFGRRLAIGFHSIPRYGDGTPMQTIDELGTYQSAGCIRQDPAKAEALYHWAEVGTTVVVLE